MVDHLDVRVVCYSFGIANGAVAFIVDRSSVYTNSQRLKSGWLLCVSINSSNQNYSANANGVHDGLLILFIPPSEAR